ncbi:XdhC family protein [Brachybacterium sp. J144]|uniref:XdhC family protein n=1 Tax=Brachybacterium sp. J144 TaxID=3116487 RepID=UPI002E794CBA|nr:XdhC family protein [Brachybacterium sp. J144]MEE1649962.1 XdhC family protein [Brachybacterium sp. J144]
MSDILASPLPGGLAAACTRWLEAGKPLALATIVATEGSAPRPLGTTMVIGEGGLVRGSLSGGCVESDLIEQGLEVLATGVPERRTYGYTDAAAWEVGLMCGGSIDVLVQPLAAPDPAAGLDALLDGAPGALLWNLDEPSRRLALPVPLADDAGEWEGPLAALLAGADGPGATGEADATGGASEPVLFVDPALVRRLAAQLAARTAAGETGIVSLPTGCGLAAEGIPALPAPDAPELFLLVRRPAPRLIVSGTTDLAAALLAQGRTLGYDTTVVDPRSTFLTRERFPAADRIVVARPDRYLREEDEAGRLDHRTVIACLGHDPKIDDPLVETALSLPVAYVGAMGSRRTHDERIRRLLERGVTIAQLEALHSPIGMDLGGSTPAEFALSVMAEVVAERTGRAAAAPLRTTTGPLHGRIPA